MISDALQKWTVVIIVCLSGVHPQMMPMGYGYRGPMMMQAPMQMAMPMPMPVPVPMPIPYTESTFTTTTTTTETNQGMAIAIPIPVPHFVQMAIPGVMPPNCTPKGKSNGNNGRNKNCPPCPPCSCNPCTPSFFSYCSPCHQECRCKNGQENPIPKDPTPPHPMPGPAFPMPIPMPGPAPVVIVPFPPQFAHPPKKPRAHNSDCDSRSVSKSNSCSETDSNESDHSWGKKRRRKKKKKSKYDITRRNFNLMKRNRDDSGLVNPVLTYRSRNGDIKMRRRLTNDEADILLGERYPYEMERERDGETYSNVRLMAGEDENKRPRIVLTSNPGMRVAGKQRRKQLELNGDSQQMLGDGKKELVFRTSDNKKISNLSVSFNIGS